MTRVAGRNLTNEEIRAEVQQYGHVRTDAEMKLAKSSLEMRRLGMLLLANEDGKLLLSVLEDLYYDGTIVGADPHMTYFNCGQREVVIFLRGLRNQAKEK